MGFDIVLYDLTEFSDESLVNEAGDIMFRMEYPEASEKSGWDYNKTREEYLSPDSAGKYSEDIEKLYRGRKKSGEGKDPNNNPYPKEKWEK